MEIYFLMYQYIHFVQPSNDPPEISNILDQEISEDSILEVQIDAQDIDMDSLTFNATCDNADS